MALKAYTQAEYNSLLQQENFPFLKPEGIYNPLERFENNYPLLFRCCHIKELESNTESLCNDSGIHFTSNVINAYHTKRSIRYRDEFKDDPRVCVVVYSTKTLMSIGYINKNYMDDIADQLIWFPRDKTIRNVDVSKCILKIIHFGANLCNTESNNKRKNYIIFNEKHDKYIYFSISGDRIIKQEGPYYLNYQRMLENSKIIFRSGIDKYLTIGNFTYEIIPGVTIYKVKERYDDESINCRFDMFMDITHYNNDLRWYKMALLVYPVKITRDFNSIYSILIINDLNIPKDIKNYIIKKIQLLINLTKN
jgi:hypothetical protein